MGKDPPFVALRTPVAVFQCQLEVCFRLLVLPKTNKKRNEKRVSRHRHAGRQAATVGVAAVAVVAVVVVVLVVVHRLRLLLIAPVVECNGAAFTMPHHAKAGRQTTETSKFRASTQ